MIFNYVVSDTPDRNNAIADMALILSGETDLANLSTHCNKELSHFVSDGKPLRPWTIEYNDVNAVILKRGHSQDNTYMTWMDIRGNGDTLLRLCPLSDGTAGVRTNVCAYSTSTNSSYNSRPKYMTPGLTFRIIANDVSCAIVSRDYSEAAVWSEILEIDKNTDFRLDNTNMCMSIGNGNARWYTSKGVPTSGAYAGLPKLNLRSDNGLAYITSNVRQTGINRTSVGEYPSFRNAKLRLTVAEQVLFTGMPSSGQHRNCASGVAGLGFATNNTYGPQLMLGQRHKTTDGRQLILIALQAYCNVTYNNLLIEF